jgi:raffinose/stachyose/melibiose transport system permease protein
MMTTVWQFAPFYMIVYSAAIVGLPQDVYEAARLDGAGPVRQFFSITLPLLKPVIITTLLLSVVGSIKFFDLVYVMTGGGPNASTELLATYMFRQGFLTFRFGYASAIATAMLLLSLAAALFVLLRTRRAERKA